MAAAERSPLVAIVGPTGVGKTSLAVALCQKLDGEIVSADSRQVYQGMDIGTDKPTPEQRSLVPHHLVDIVRPDEEFTLAQYQELAYLAIDGILQRKKVPFLVGGTGLYVRSVLEGFMIPRVEPDARLRERLRQQAELEGGASLHGRLQEVDPEAAAGIDPRNLRRVIRALEVFETTGEPISVLQNRRQPPYRVLKVGLTMERRQLYRKIDERVERMMERGLADEVQRLVKRGYGPDLPAMAGLGYRQICGYLQGETELDTAVQRIKSETHRFVRQQYMWFRLDARTIHWFDVLSTPLEEIRELIEDFLQKTS